MALSDLERDEANHKYMKHGEFYNCKSRALSDLVYNWLFILNSGGLVSVVTMLTTGYAKSNHISVIWMHISLIAWMGVSFIAGILFIFSASQLSRWQTDKRGELLDRNFTLLTSGTMTVGAYENAIYAEIFPCELLMNFVELLSIFCFVIGFILGFKILV